MTVEKAKHAHEVMSQLKEIQESVRRAKQAGGIMDLAKACDGHIHWSQEGREAFQDVQARLLGFLETKEQCVLKEIERI